MKKKSLLVLILTLICSLASAQITITVNGINYLLKDNVATVWDNSQSRSVIGNVIIPAEISYNEKKYPVVSVAQSAFYDCDLLVSITLPESVTYIGRTSFSNCDKLISVNLSDELYQIDEAAFYNCINLTEITLPKSLITFSSDAFAGCQKLTNINVDAENLFYTSVDGVLFDKDMTTLYKYPYARTATHYVVPAGVKIINQSAFASSKAIIEIYMPNTVTTISNSAFYGCLSLVRINIPASVNFVDASVLSLCGNLEEVYSEAKFASQASSSAFSGISLSRCKLYVPKGSKTDYSSSTGWKIFTQIIEVDESQAIIKHSVGINKNEGGVASINGVVLSNAFINIEDKQKITLSVAPDAGYVVESVRLDGKDITNLLNNGLYEIESLIQNTTFTISFRRSEMFTIKLSHAENGGISMNAEEGTSHAFKISTIPGWAINTVMFNGTDVTEQLDADSNFITPLITGNSSIQVSFEKIPSSVISQELNKVSVYTSNGELIVKDAKEGHTILVYNDAGVLLRTVPVVNDIMRVSLPNLKGIYIININNRSYKVSHN